MSEQGILLQNGLKVLSGQQSISFTRYARTIIPADGFVYWMNTGSSFMAKGSFHYSTDNEQNDTQTVGKNSVVFTTTEAIDDFNVVGDSTLYIGTIDNIQFAFTQRGKLYKAANLYHYTGHSINPIMRSQIIDNILTFDNSTICNDSLPIFMSMNHLCPVYPAFRVDQNIRPPYAVIDVKDSVPLQQMATEDMMSNRAQWIKDTVKVTLFGMNSNLALDYIWYMTAAALADGAAFGIMNAPVAKKIDIPQSDINVTANAKEIIFDVNYYQNRTLNIAKFLIEQAFISVQINT